MMHIMPMATVLVLFSILTMTWRKGDLGSCQVSMENTSRSTVIVVLCQARKLRLIKAFSHCTKLYGQMCSYKKIRLYSIVVVHSFGIASARVRLPIEALWGRTVVVFPFIFS